MSYRNYSRNLGFLVDPGGNGDFTTIQSAITAASTAGFTGDICINPGTYTENPALVSNINLVANNTGNSTGNQVIISGKCTFSSAGTVSLLGIQLQTNSDFFLAVTGSAASIVNLTNCFLNCSNHTGISYTSSNSSSQINGTFCNGDFGTTGIGLYTSTSAGVLKMYFVDMENHGPTATASTNSAGAVALNYCNFPFVISSSSTGAISAAYSSFGLTSLNTIGVLHNGSGGGSFLTTCRCFGGSASAVSIGASATMKVILTELNSSNTNAITGAGTLNYAGLIFTGSGTGNNVSTKNLYTFT